MSSISSGSSSSLSSDNDEFLTIYVSNEDLEAAKAAEVEEKRREKLESLYLSKMPVQCFEKIAFFLDFGSVVALAQTCKRIHYILDSLYDGKIKEIPVNACASYGALADCESETNNPYKLIRVTSATLGLGHRLPYAVHRGMEHLIQFDSEGIPSVSKYDELMESDPFVQKFGGRASFYRGDYLRQVHKEITARREQFGMIFREFLSKELDPIRPLQDLRNRAIRVNVLQMEHQMLDRAWSQTTSFHRRFSNSLPFLERKLYGAKWFAGYDFKIPTWDYRVISQIPFDYFCHRKLALLGSKTILLREFEVPVAIPVRVYGKLERQPMLKELKGSTFFSVFIRDKQVASCEFIKVWNSDGRVISEADTRNTHRVTKEDRAHIEMKIDEIAPNSVIYDLPHFPSGKKKLCCKKLLENLFKQLAAEVLLREDFPALRARVVNPRMAGYGFSPTSLILHKKDFAPETSSSTEKFSRLRDEDGNAALVPFEKEPTTWEEHFARHGYLIGNSTEPVLPRFITTNFEKPVVAATPTCSSH